MKTNHDAHMDAVKAVWNYYIHAAPYDISSIFSRDDKPHSDEELKEELAEQIKVADGVKDYLEDIEEHLRLISIEEEEPDFIDELREAKEKLYMLQSMLSAD